MTITAEGTKQLSDAGKPRMKHIDSRVLLPGTLIFLSITPLLLAEESRTEQPVIKQGVVGIKLRERGALLVEPFKGDKVDKQKWRIWHSDPNAVNLLHFFKKDLLFFCFTLFQKTKIRYNCPYQEPRW